MDTRVLHMVQLQDTDVDNMKFAKSRGETHLNFVAVGLAMVGSNGA